MSLSSIPRKLARQLIQSPTLRRTLGTNTTRKMLLAAPQQQRSFLTANYTSAAAATPNTTTSDPYTSELQDLFDIMEQNDPSEETVMGTSLAASAHRQPVKCLKCGVPEHALRFTTTSYGRTLQAPHVHPNEHRVICKVPVDCLDLSPLEYSILLEIVGPRRLERNELRLTSTQFGSRMENKRHLVSMLDRIIISCRRLAKELENEEPEALQEETA